MARVLQDMTKQRKRKIVFDELKAEQISSDDPRDDPTRTHSNMNSESRNVLIQCTLIAVLTALLNFVKTAFLRVVKCGKADLQRELDLFNELHQQNDACEWDQEGLFLAFIKGEDICGRLEKKSTLKFKAKKSTKARISNGNALTSTAKRPIIGELFPRGLYILPRPCTPFRVRSGVTMKNTVHTCDHKPNDCSVVDASVSDACLSVTKDIVTDTNQFRTLVNGCKEHTTTAPISRAYQVTHQPVHVVSLVTSPESEVNRHDDAPSVSCSYIAVLDRSNADNEVTFQETERASPSVIVKRKRLSVVRSSQDNVEKKASHRRSSAHVDKEENGSNVETFNCSSEQVDVDKSNKVKSPRIERSSFGVNKGKKRSIGAAASCSNETQKSEQSVKKPRKEPAHFRRKTPQLSSFRKMIKDKEYQKSHSKRVMQRKLMVSGVDKRLSFTGQLNQMKTSHEPASTKVAQFEGIPNANQPVQAASDQVQTAAKQPLLVTQVLLPTTSSAAELASLMEELPIAPSVDPVCDVPDVCDSYSNDESDAEHDLYPELQSLPEQVLQLIQLLA